MTVKEQLFRIQQEIEENKKRVAQERPSNWQFLNQEGRQHHYNEMFEQKRTEQRVLFEKAKADGLIGMVEEVTGEDLTTLFENRGIYSLSPDEKREWVVDIQNPILFGDGEWDTSLAIRVFHLYTDNRIYKKNATYFSLRTSDARSYKIEGKFPVLIGQISSDPHERQNELESAIAMAMTYPESTEDRVWFYSFNNRLYGKEPPQTIRDYPFMEFYHNLSEDKTTAVKLKWEMHDKRMKKIN